MRKRKIGGNQRTRAFFDKKPVEMNLIRGKLELVIIHPKKMSVERYRMPVSWVYRRL